ncbi:MAG: hypothetical protein E6J76_14970, partial [Deltaproteobacteria bacterium]
MRIIRLTPLRPSVTDHASARQDQPRRNRFMAYAVIRTGGKQYRVAPGQIVR